MINISKKALDTYNRWRSKTIAFRISPEENELLNKCVALSGQTKQSYIINKLLNKDVVVVGNPRVHAALKKQMIEICDELRRIESSKEISEDFAEIIKITTKIYNEMEK